MAMAAPSSAARCWADCSATPSSKDIDCDDQPYAFSTYSNGLNGDVGRRYDWNHGQSRGYFQPTREYRRSGVQCRDFTETTYRGDRELTQTGTACRANDGQWRFD